MMVMLRHLKDLGIWVRSRVLNLKLSRNEIAELRRIHLVLSAWCLRRILTVLLKAWLLSEVARKVNRASTCSSIVMVWVLTD